MSENVEKSRQLESCGIILDKLCARYLLLRQRLRAGIILAIQ